MTPNHSPIRSTRTQTMTKSGFGLRLLLSPVLFLFFVLIFVSSSAHGQDGSDGGSSSGSQDVWAGVEEMVVSGSTAGGILADVARSNSVTAFDSKDLEAIGAADISDIANFTPNLEIVTAGSTSPTFFIRGIGLNDFNANAAGAVAIYTDDVPLNSPALQLGSLFDIENAAVLRGPQGTGPFRNASAGAIKVYSKKPTGDFGASFSAELGNFDSQDYQGSIQFPITDESLWARISFRSSTREGTFRNRCAGAPAIADREQQEPGIGQVDQGYCGENVAPNQFSNVDPNQPEYLNSRSNWAMRGVFLIKPDLSGDVDMDWLLTVRGSRRDEPSFVGQSIGTTGTNRFIDETLPANELNDVSKDLRPPIFGHLGGGDFGGFIDPDITRATEFTFNQLLTECTPCTPAEAFGRKFQAERLVATQLARDLKDDPQLGGVSHDGGTTNDTYGTSLKGSVEFGDSFELTSITAFDGWQRVVDVDLDFSPNTLFEINTEDDGWQIFQELRLNGQSFDDLDEIFGGPLDWEFGAFVLAEDLNVDVKVDFGVANGLSQAPKRREYNQTLLTLAAYSSFSWDFWDAFTLDGGVRMNYEKRQINYDLYIISTLPRNSKTRLIGEEPTGTIRMTYRPNEESSIYAKFTHGWKSGTFNATGSAQLGVTTARPEKIDAFEVGLRGSYFENRLQLSGAIFHYAYEDYQLFTSLTAFQSPPQFVILNASDVELYGAEVEATILPWDGGLMDIKFSWLEGTFLNFVQTQLKTQTIQSPFFAIIPVSTDNSGNRLLNAPQYSITLTLQQAIPLGRFGALVARWDGTWKSTTYFDASEGRGLPNQDLDLVLPRYTIGQSPYWIHNVRLAYITPSENLNVAFWVRNVADESFKAFSADLQAFQKTTLHFVGDPRTFGVTTSIQF